MTQGPTPLDSAPHDPRFREELETVFWLQQEVREGRQLPVTEADAVTHSLYVAMQRDGPRALPQLPLHDMSEYVAVHAINVSLLAMALGEFISLDDTAVRELGMAALLHDVGMALIPVAMLEKAEQLSPDERERIKRHPVDGARIIIEADAALDLAAVVAFEHHINPQGTGYPALAYPRTTHVASRLVLLCDTYHAMRSPRPYRKAWPADMTISFVRERAGFDFDAELAGSLVQMVAQRGA